MYCLCYKGIEQPVRLQEEAPWGRPWPVPEDVFPVLPELHWAGPEEYREGAGGEGSITIRTHRYRGKQITISVQTQRRQRQSITFSVQNHLFRVNQLPVTILVNTHGFWINQITISVEIHGKRGIQVTIMVWGNQSFESLIKERRI